MLATSACGIDPVEPRAVASTHDELTTLHDVARKSLLAHDAMLAAWITQFGEANGLWPWFAADGVYLHPGADLLTGRDAVRDFLRTTYPDPAAQTQYLHQVTGDVSGDARLGYTFGWFEEDVRAADGTITKKFGRYVATWTRDRGLWRIAAFVRNPAGRAPSPPPADAGIMAGEHGVVQPGDPIALAEEARAADTEFAALSVAQGYTVAFTSFCAPDAVIGSGGNYFWNAAGVARFWGGWQPGETFQWAPLIARAAGSGDLAFTVGNASLDNGTAVDRRYSKYLTVWIHQADGSWRFLTDAGNARPAPTTP